MRTEDEPDFSGLDDPTFLDERARLRDQLDNVPGNATNRAEMERLYEAMTREFDRRASAAWNAAT